MMTSGLGLGHVRAASAIEKALEGDATIETIRALPLALTPL